MANFADQLNRARTAARDCLDVARRIRRWAVSHSETVARAEIDTPEGWQSVFHAFCEILRLIPVHERCIGLYHQAFTPEVEDAILTRCADPNRLVQFAGRKMALGHRAALVALREAFLPVRAFLRGMEGHDPTDYADFQNEMEDVMRVLRVVIQDIRALDLHAVEDLAELIDAEWAASNSEFVRCSGRDPFPYSTASGLGREEEVHHSSTSGGVESKGASTVWPPARGWGFSPGMYSFNGQEFALSGKPWLILNKLVQSRTSVSANVMREAVWGGDSLVGDNAIQKLVSDLRAKLRRDLRLSRTVDPIPCVDRGPNLAWKIADPARLANA